MDKVTINTRVVHREGYIHGVIIKIGGAVVDVLVSKADGRLIIPAGTMRVCVFENGRLKTLGGNIVRNALPPYHARPVEPGDIVSFSRNELLQYGDDECKCCFGTGREAKEL